MRCVLRFGLLALCWLAALRALPADAQVRRCMKPNGDIVYTDRRCSEFDAIERAAEHGPTDRRIYRGGCPRTLRDLVFEMTLAIDARDVNQLASVYHWTGMSSGSARATMKRLQAVAQRPLVAVEPVMSTPPSRAPATRLYRLPRRPATDDGDYRPRAVAIRVEQTLDDGMTPSRTVFDLHEYFGCLWIR